MHPGSQPPDRPAPEQDDRRAQVARIGPQVFDLRAVLVLDLGAMPQPLPERSSPALREPVDFSDALGNLAILRFCAVELERFEPPQRKIGRHPSRRLADIAHKQRWQHHRQRDQGRVDGCKQVRLVECRPQHITHAFFTVRRHKSSTVLLGVSSAPDFDGIRAAPREKKAIFGQPILDYRRCSLRGAQRAMINPGLQKRSGALDRGGDLRHEHRPPRCLGNDVARRSAAAANEDPLQHVCEFGMSFGPHQ